MGIMGFLRNQAGLIIVLAIGFAILAFLVGDAIQYGSAFWQGGQNTVGEVAGETIEYQDFNAKLERNQANMKQQMGGTLNAQMAAYIMENTWKQEVSTILLNKEVSRLGLIVGSSELNDMVTGKNPDPQIVQNFGDPKTGQLNRAQLNVFLGSVDTQGPEMKAQWESFLNGLKQNRLSQKYFNLVSNSLYVTSLEAREDYQQRNRLANFNYVMLNYASVPADQAKPTDADYSEYYESHKSFYNNEEESRSLEYVVFDASPSKQDSAEVKNSILKLAADFSATKTDSLFVSINSDSKAPIAYLRKGQVDPALDSLVFKASAGTVVGPVLSNGAYKMAKVLDVRMSPDSVKASHILINPATEGGLDKAKTKADSIASLIRKGASLAELAKKFSVDGSKDQGGSLPTFARGAMVKEFEDAAFDGKTGDLKVVVSQFGVHILHIDKQIGSSRVAKVAQVDKVLVSSSKTLEGAYSKSMSFLGSVSDPKSFEAQAQKAGLVKQLAENLSASQGTIPGFENSRKVIQWAFKADEGDVSQEVFSSENKYLVARLTDIRKKGVLPLEKVKKQIEPMVINAVKAKVLSEKIETALQGASSLSQVAKKIGATVTPVSNIVFANPIIPGLAQENKVVGTVFGLQPNKLSKAITGEQGVYVVSVSGFNNPAPLTNTYKQKEQMIQSLTQQAQGQAFKVLTEKAKIKDNRILFF